MKSILSILTVVCFITTASVAFSESTFTCNTDTVSASYVLAMAERLEQGKHDTDRDFAKQFSESFETVAWWDRSSSNPLTSAEKVKLQQAVTKVITVTKRTELTPAQAAFYAPYQVKDQVGWLELLQTKLTAIETK